VQGQFDDTEQGGGSKEDEYDPEFEAENGGRRRRKTKQKGKKSGNKRNAGARK
jgi:hypothetical protein